MKKVIIALAATFVALATYAQGSLVFDTLAVDYKVQRPGGAPPGTGVIGQLFLVNADSSLTALTPSAAFYDTTAPAAAQVYIVAPDSALIVPGVAAGQPATLRFRAFNGASYAGSSVFGESSNFTLTLGGGVNPPPNLDPLAGQTLTLTVVPEPSTIALAGLGVAALLFRRRK